jgi:lysophospholipid acyltransferase (LPLAT)-like uncharacterized protein
MTPGEVGPGKGRKGDPWKVALVERLGSALLAALGCTLRFQVEGARVFQELRERRQPVIFAFWHSRILPLAHLHRNQGVVVLVSEHRDGEYIARIVARRGFGTARGSSTRGGVRGLRELIRAGRAGRDLAVTPDGPKGPPRRVKWGTLVAAQVTGFPVIPVAAGGEGVWRVNSWDRFVIPRPFARIRVRYGTPLQVPRDAGPEELRTLAARLDGELNQLTDEVDGARTDPVRPVEPYLHWLAEAASGETETGGHA